MAREHAPIGIGVPPETAWRAERPEPIVLVAFFAGDDPPDPGEAFLAAARAFGIEPSDPRPVPSDDPALAWAFAFELVGRAAPVLIWCDRVDPAQSPDGAAPDAVWSIAIESILERADPSDRDRASARGRSVWPAPVADFVALAATAIGSVEPDRLRLLYDPALAQHFDASECGRLFLQDAGEPGALVDERFLYRVEARVRADDAPVWVSTVGLSRLGRPELEILEVPPVLATSALELVDAVAARLVSEALPQPGAPFEIGERFAIALVPAAEVAATVEPTAPGGTADRAHLAPVARAAICAPQQRGSYRRIWTSPISELERLDRHEVGLFLAPRVVEVRERLARSTWPNFVNAFTGCAPVDGVVFLAKIAVNIASTPPSVAAPPGAPVTFLPDATGLEDAGPSRAHLWIRVTEATQEGGGGVTQNEAAVPHRFAIADVGDWRVIGYDSGPTSISPSSVERLD